MVSAQPKATSAPGQRRWAAAGAQLFRLRAFIVLFALVAAFAILSPAFLTSANLTILVKHVAINAILAVGMTFVILSGGIDLSVGSVAGLAGIVAGGLIHPGLVLHSFGVVVYFHTWLVIAIALLAGALVGAVNGVLVAQLQGGPFHRHPWLAVCGPRRGPADFQWRHVSQPGRQAGPG